MEPLSWCHDGTKTVYPIELQQVAKSNCSRSVRQLTPLKQFFHEIGSRTYSDAEYESARQLSGSVNSYVREGMRTFIRENRSYIRTVWPRPAGLQLGIGTKAFGKGLTPAGRLYLGKAAVAGTMGIWTYDIYHITTVRLTIRETDVSG